MKSVDLRVGTRTLRSVGGLRLRYWMWQPALSPETMIMLFLGTNNHFASSYLYCCILVSLPTLRYEYLSTYPPQRRNRNKLSLLSTLYTHSVWIHESSDVQPEWISLTMPDFSGFAIWINYIFTAIIFGSLWSAMRLVSRHTKRQVQFKTCRERWDLHKLYNVFIMKILLLGRI